MGCEVPEIIASVYGINFQSNLFGANQTRTTSYHPQSYGAVKRFHRQLKKLVYGSALKLHGEFFFSSLPNVSAPQFQQFLRRNVRALKPVPASRHSSCSIFVTKDLFYSPCVFLRFNRVRRPLEPPYTGPYKVVKMTPKVFTLEIDGKQHTVYINRLKPAHLFSEIVNKDIPDVVTRFGIHSFQLVRFQSSLSS
ncbi:pol polyprotein [Nephila pilipes]|uniref:Pol polyprotein n=1 Tax=Nephila pilipes TaxID=299642 RepID=A0A8X6QUW1_NEPPI|nr:pol polyprotein [Nephila pilipes]